MPAFVQLPQLIEYVLSAPQTYPGLHNIPQERTIKGLPTLDPIRQMRRIWEATCSYLKRQLSEGKSVHVEHLGSFTFATSVSTYQSVSYDSALNMTPVFSPCKALASMFKHYHGKEQTPSQPGSSYQQGLRMTYLNKMPIAKDCHYSERVVGDALVALFRGLGDLALREYNVDLEMVFARITVQGGALRVKFSAELNNKVKEVQKRWPLAKRVTQTTKESGPGWRKGSMLTFESPAQLLAFRDMTKKLANASLDLNSCCQIRDN